LAEGLATKTGQPVQNFMWMDYAQLEALTALGSAAGITGSASQLLDNASILPGMFAENPQAALMALQQYTCQNQGSLGGLLGTIILGAVRIPKGPGIGENVRIPGWILPVAAGALTAWWAAYYWYKSKHPELPDPIVPPMPQPAQVTPTATSTGECRVPGNAKTWNRTIFVPNGWNPVDLIRSQGLGLPPFHAGQPSVSKKQVECVASAFKQGIWIEVGGSVAPISFGKWNGRTKAGVNVGDWVLADGHNRFLGSLLSGVSLKTFTPDYANSKGFPLNAVPWDSFEWGKD